MIRTAILGAVLLALTVFGLSLHTPGAGTVGSAEAKVLLVEVLGVSAAVYLVAVACAIWRPAAGRAVWLVLAIAVAMRVPLIVAPPFLSSDVYRYVWDGRVQAAGVNPYRYLPSDKALETLRDEAVWPHINRADYAPTIYPPMAQAVFAAIGLVWPAVTGEKVAMFGFECLAVGCLMALLRSAGLPAERVLIYAWNPLPVWAFAGNGHIDAAVCGLVALALLLRVRHRDGWAGVALGAATLTKFLPVIIAPVLWRQAAGLWRKWAEPRGLARVAAGEVARGTTPMAAMVPAAPSPPSWPDLFRPSTLRLWCEDGRAMPGHGGRDGAAGWWKLPATALGTVIVLYSFYLSAGWKVFGFLSGYGQEEGLSNGSGIWLLAGLEQIATLPHFAGPLYLAILAAVLIALGIRYAFICPPGGAVEVCAAASVLMAVLTWGISPHYPWYFAWLAVPCVLAPGPAVLWLATAPVLIYLDTYGDRFAWPSLVFAPAVLLALAPLALRNKRKTACPQQP